MIIICTYKGSFGWQSPEILLLSNESGNITGKLSSEERKSHTKSSRSSGSGKHDLFKIYTHIIIPIYYICSLHSF